MKTVTKLLLALSVVVVAACGPLKYEIKGTSLATGADAVITADVKKDQAMTMLEVKATNLPPPDRVMSGASTFVVWQRKDSGATWARVGVLTYDEGKREGQFMATVPELTFEVQLTAEREAAPESPGPDAVFFQKIN
jgi:hypothetical protein